MTSVTAGNKSDAYTSSSLPVPRRAKERRARTGSTAGSTDVQLLTKVHGISLIQVSEEFSSCDCDSVMNTADRPERLPKAIRVQNTLFNQYNLINRKKWQKRIIARDQL